MPRFDFPRRGFAAATLASLSLLASETASAQSATSRAPSYPDHTKLLVVRNADGEERPVASRSDWLVRRDHILAHLQEVMGPLPGGERRVPLDLETIETIDEPKYVRRKIRYSVEPGDRVTSWLLVPKSAKRPLPAMLCLHQTTSIGKDEPVGLGGKVNLRYAKELAERGYVTIAPDYPNFGESKFDAYAAGYASASMKGIWNHLRAVDVIVGLAEVDPARIGVIGHSLGGHNSIFAALFDPRLRVVVTSCGFNDFPHYYGGKIAGWSHAGYMPRLLSVYGLDPARVPFDFPELLGALAPRAVFVNAPKRDANFDVVGVELCVASARPVFELLGAGDRLRAVHPDTEHDFPPEIRESAYRFIDEILGGEARAQSR